MKNPEGDEFNQLWPSLFDLPIVNWDKTWLGHVLREHFRGTFGEKKWKKYIFLAIYPHSWYDKTTSIDSSA